MSELINGKHLIFLGGEAGVGKSVSAREIQKHLSSSIVIDKDEATSVLVNALLKRLGKSPYDRESKTYLKKVKPLEYKQLDEQLEINMEYKIRIKEKELESLKNDFETNKKIMGCKYESKE